MDKTDRFTNEIKSTKKPVRVRFQIIKLDENNDNNKI